MKKTLQGGIHTVITTSVAPVCISWQGTPFAIATGRYKATLRGSGDLEIDDPGKKGLKNVEIFTKGVSETEQIDDRDLPAPPDPSNMLQMLRAKVRQEMGVTREAFGDIYSPYEIDDIDPFDVVDEVRQPATSQTEGEEPSSETPPEEPSEASNE